MPGEIKADITVDSKSTLPSHSYSFFVPSLSQTPEIPVPEFNSGITFDNLAPDPRLVALGLAEQRIKTKLALIDQKLEDIISLKDAKQNETIFRHTLPIAWEEYCQLTRRNVLIPGINLDQFITEAEAKNWKLETAWYEYCERALINNDIKKADNTNYAFNFSLTDEQLQAAFDNLNLESAASTASADASQAPSGVAHKIG